MASSPPFLVAPQVGLLTQPNERRCTSMQEAHTLQLPCCCPVSHNPRAGSTVTIRYTPAGQLLEVAALKAYVDSFVGGRGAVRSMEGLVQTIAADCAQALGVPVVVTARLLLFPTQEMELVCCHG